MTKTTWTRKDVSEITGIPDRRLLFYSEQNVIPGFIEKKTVGRGTPRSYSIEDIFYLMLIRELDALGLSLARIKSVIIFLHVMKHQELWVNGRFTKEEKIMIISLQPRHHTAAEGTQAHKEDFDMTWVSGSSSIKMTADRPSMIVVNLNEIFKKAGI